MLARLIFIGCFALFAWSPVCAQEIAPPLAQTGPVQMGLTIGQAMGLGIVEGLTEYLPISSTGHLLLAERALGIGVTPSGSLGADKLNKDALDAYTICIQAGAILAVLALYFRRTRQMVRGLIGRDDEGRQLLLNVGAAFLPAAVVGLLFNNFIKSHLFGLWPVTLAWFVGGLAILALGRSRGGIDWTGQGGLPVNKLSWQMALIIGLAQCIAMWPGVSRSLVTIVSGVFLGLSLPAAVEFSFLLGLITLGAATGYDTLKHGQLMMQTFNASALFIGVVFAFVFAVLSMKWMVGYLSRRGLAIFGYYRITLALLTGAFLITGAL